MKRTLRRLQCRLLGHRIECTVSVFLLDQGEDIQHHEHFCHRCERVVLSEYEPVTPGMRNLMGDMLQLVPDEDGQPKTAWVN